MAEMAASELVQRLIEAAEAEGREHALTPRDYRLIRGKRLTGVTGRFVYCFEAPAKIPIKEGSSADLRVAESCAPVTLSRKSGASIELAVPIDLGPDVPEATLLIEDSGLAEALVGRLTATIGDNSEFNSTLARKLFNAQQLNTQPQLEALRPVDGLTEEQQRAAAGLSALEAGFLWGPPGTGKTATLAALAHAAFSANRRTLIVSQTNDAVDALLEALCRRISGRAKLAIPEGSVIRLGAISRAELLESFGPQVQRESVLARVQAKTTKRLEELRSDHRKIRQQIAELETTATLLRSEGVLTVKLDELKAKRDIARPGIFATLRRVFFGWGKVRQIVVDETVDLDAEIRLVESGLKKVILALGDSERARVAANLADVKAEEPEIGAAVAQLEEVIREAHRATVENARTVATTATRAILTPDLLRGFDLVIIEEASMLPLPAVYLLAGLAENQVIIAGDFRQLPPIATSTNALVKEWYARDIFEASGIVCMLERGEAPPCLFSLSAQFRCREEIAKLFSHAFYGGVLKSSYQPKLSLEFSGRLAALSGRPVVLVDTSRLAPRGHMVSRSKANLVHAALARELWGALAKQPGLAPDSAIGILAPYRPQVALLRELMNEDGGQDVAVGTVHRFQGDERPVIILDLTESAPHRLGSFLGATVRRDAGARLLNVALSRAQEQLIILADLSYLKGCLVPQQILHGIIAALEADGAVVDAAQLLAPSPADPATPRMALFSRAMFLSALIEDLRGASSSCTIVSPMVASALVKVLVNAAVTRPEPISWRVLVPPYRDGVSASRDEYEDALDLIAQVGGEILYVSEDVQPFVAIDDSIVWTGSLNPLSCLESDRGAMIRLTGPAAVSAARRLLTPQASTFLPSCEVANS